MIKPTPSPPENENTSPYTSLDSKRLHPATERYLDFHFPNSREETRKPIATLYSASPDAWKVGAQSLIGASIFLRH